ELSNCRIVASKYCPGSKQIMFFRESHQCSVELSNCRIGESWLRNFVSILNYASFMELYFQYIHELNKLFHIGNSYERIKSYSQREQSVRQFDGLNSSTAFCRIVASKYWLVSKLRKFLLSRIFR